MNKAIKITIVAVLIAAVVVAIVVRQNKSVGDEVPAEFRPEQLTGKGLPVMIDLGSDQCIPCKMMAPIIEELKTEYAGTLTVHFLDVRKLPALSKLYGIKLIPTQIFYDASGKELFRHEGFYAKEDIIAKWKEFGVNLAGDSAGSPAFERLTAARADNRTNDQICYMCDGKVASLEPSTAVAWFGQRQKPDGTWGSAGCFHQGFFVNPVNLKKWVEQIPYETGRQISISHALADKMKLSPEQIQKACKIGECSPK